MHHYTQAIMDLGATLCTRSRPACSACPVQADCVAFADGEVERYPGKKPKRDTPLRRTTMVMAVAGGELYLERRPASGIWGGLWSLPETDGDASTWCRETLSGDPADSTEWSTLRHSFSHYDLDIRPIVLRLNDASRTLRDSDDVRWVSLDAEMPGGIAAPVKKLIDVLRNDVHVTNR